MVEKLIHDATVEFDAALRLAALVYQQSIEEAHTRYSELMMAILRPEPKKDPNDS